MTEPVVHLLPEAPDLPHPLGRHVNLDPRSRAYAFSAPAEVQLKSVHWDRAVPIFDQGNLGSCTGNAAAGWLATDNALRPGIADGLNVLFGVVNEDLAVRLYERATVIDPYDGSYPPDDTGSDGLSVTKVLVEWGAVDSYQHAFSVDAALAALQFGPVLVGTVWHQGMFDPGPHAVVTISGPVVGGHEYLAVGYDADRREVTFANSWGSGWGDAGYFRMTVDTLAALLADDGDATVPHALVAAPTPTPGPGATFPVDLDPDVAAHVRHVAAKRGITESAWVSDRLRKYFG